MTPTILDYGDQAVLTADHNGEFRYWSKGTRGTIVAITSGASGYAAYLRLTAWGVFDRFPLDAIRRLAPLELLAEAAE